MAAAAVECSQPLTFPVPVPDLRPKEDSPNVRVIDLAETESAAALEVSKACLENGFFYGAPY